MKRKTADERVKAFRLDRLQDLQQLARKSARWAKDHKEELARAEPLMPDGLNDRQEDCCRPLFAIADLVAGDCPEAARAAAQQLFGAAREDASVKEQLLADIKRIFDARGTDRLFSEQLVASLVEMEDRPWAEWGHSRKPMSKAAVAKQLKSFEIRPKQIRIGDDTLKGYEREWFEDSFERYLSSKSKHPKQVKKDGVDSKMIDRNSESGRFGSATPKEPIGTEDVSDVSAGADLFTRQGNEAVFDVGLEGEREPAP